MCDLNFQKMKKERKRRVRKQEERNSQEGGKEGEKDHLYKVTHTKAIL